MQPTIPAPTTEAPPKVFTRFMCRVCGKLTTGRVPSTKWARGDGTFRYPRRHKAADGKQCPGSLQSAIWVDLDQNGNIIRTIDDD